MDGPDRRGTEEIRPGANMLEPFLEVGSSFLEQKWFHNNGRRDGVGKGLKETEPETCKKLFLPTEENAHAGLRIVLEVQELSDLDEDVVGQALCFVDDQDGMDFVRAMELNHMVLDSAEKRGAAPTDRKIEGRREMAVEFGQRDGRMAEVNRLVEAHGESRDE